MIKKYLHTKEQYPTMLKIYNKNQKIFHIKKKKNLYSKKNKIK
jgi:hypothetical protein